MPPPRTRHVRVYKSEASRRPTSPKKAHGMSSSRGNMSLQFVRRHMYATRMVGKLRARSSVNNPKPLPNNQHDMLREDLPGTHEDSHAALLLKRHMRLGRCRGVPASTQLLGRNTRNGQSPTRPHQPRGNARALKALTIESQLPQSQQNDGVCVPA